MFSDLKFTLVIFKRIDTYMKSFPVKKNRHII